MAVVAEGAGEDQARSVGIGLNPSAQVGVVAADAEADQAVLAVLHTALEAGQIVEQSPVVGIVLVLNPRSGGAVGPDAHPAIRVVFADQIVIGRIVE